MTRSLKIIGRFLGVSIGGYLLIAALQTLVLEIALGGDIGPGSPVLILGLAMAGTVMSGLIGGYVAAWLGGARPLLHVVGILAALALDAIYVLAKDVGGHPVWFSLGGALALLAATAVGGWIRAAQRSSRVRAG